MTPKKVQRMAQQKIMMCILQVHVKSLQEQAAGTFPALQDAEQSLWGVPAGFVSACPLKNTSFVFSHQQSSRAKYGA